MTIRVIKIRLKGAVALRRLRLSDVIKMAVLPVSPFGGSYSWSGVRGGIRSFIITNSINALSCGKLCIILSISTLILLLTPERGGLRLDRLYGETSPDY